jgi:hypothetical protein
MHVLDLCIHGKTVGPSRYATLASCLTKFVRLGGYLTRIKELPPGNAITWHEVFRLSAHKIRPIEG